LFRKALELLLLRSGERQTRETLRRSSSVNAPP
jgi:hypothetical protein